MPLTDEEIEEEKEFELYIVSFVDNLDNPVCSHVKRTSTKRKQPTMEAPQSVEPSPPKTLNIYWQGIFQYDKSINFEDLTMKENFDKLS